MSGINSELLKTHARSLGFDLCGVAAADAYPELQFLDEWLARGYAGSMRWLAQSAARRSDVRAVLPAARSVIVTGTLYNTRADAAPPSRTHGEIARYAGGHDYHHVLQRRLEALVDWMRTVASEPFDARVYVDGGPVQERVYAQYAGLGWIGKNTCLINPELGSMLFLGEILCTLPLEPDTQGLEQCGSCTRCLEACPTGALVEPGVLDSNRCISYLTIELRESIPAGLRSAIGNHIYGCDVCQTVCPYNQPPATSSDPAWRPPQELTLPELARLWRCPDDELQTLIRGTAMTRAKLTGLRRNIASAIGNSGDPDAIAALAVPRDDSPSIDDPMVQEHVRWALERHAVSEAALLTAKHTK